MALGILIFDGWLRACKDWNPSGNAGVFYLSTLEIQCNKITFQGVDGKIHIVRGLPLNRREEWIRWYRRVRGLWAIALEQHPEINNPGVALAAIWDAETIEAEQNPYHVPALRWGIEWLLEAHGIELASVDCLIVEQLLLSYQYEQPAALEQLFAYQPSDTFEPDRAAQPIPEAVSSATHTLATLLRMDLTPQDVQWVADNHPYPELLDILQEAARLAHNEAKESERRAEYQRKYGRPMPSVKLNAQDRDDIRRSLEEDGLSTDGVGSDRAITLDDFR